MSDVNIPLLRKAVEWAEAEAAKPLAIREWNQVDWVATPEDFHWVFGAGVKAPECGTCYCIAGYIAANTLRSGETIDDHGETIHGADGTFEWISDRASRELGLDVPESSDLFCGANTIKDVRRIAEDIAGERL